MYNLLLLTLFAALSHACGMTRDEVINRARGIPGSQTADLNAQNVQNVKAVFSESQWNSVLTHVNSEYYTYNALLKAVARFPDFCADTSTCSTELAFAFAHFSQETGAHAGGEEWKQTFKFGKEAARPDGSRPNYIDWSQHYYTPAAGKNYFGRGAKQLSWNYNYGPFSYFMYGNKDTLLNDPDLLLEEDKIITSALFFYMLPQAPKPSMHDVILGCWTPPNGGSLTLGQKFAWTTSIINGAVECPDAAGQNRAETRFNYFVKWAEYFNVAGRPASGSFSSNDCKDLPDFSTTDSVSSLQLYYKKDVTFADSCGCELVSFAKGGSTDFFVILGQLGSCEVHNCGQTGGSSPCRIGEKNVDECEGKGYHLGGTSRCGTGWLDADRKCGKRCSANYHCPDGETCFGGMSLLKCNTIRCAKVDNKFHLIDGSCGNLCDGTDALCEDGQKCYHDLDHCDAFHLTDKTKRCGASWTDANNKCGTLCEGTDFNCPSGEGCFAGLNAATCNGNGRRL